MILLSYVDANVTINEDKERRNNMEKDKRIAVLIDADNVSGKYIKYILDELANHGTPTIKRIYGDWTKPDLSAWKSVLLDYSITPIQQYSYTTGKNSTDASLIIDAMDILYSSNVEAFCIVSSDSDFTRLAARLREEGMYVIGMGEKKTPKPFISACEIFKYLDVLASKNTVTLAPSSKSSTVKDKNGIAERNRLIAMIRQIVEDCSNEDGWAYLSEVGTRINKRNPDFDVRNYGHSKLRPLIKSTKAFMIQAEKTDNPRVNLYYIKNKEKND